VPRSTCATHVQYVQRDRQGLCRAGIAISALRARLFAEPVERDHGFFVSVAPGMSIGSDTDLLLCSQSLTYGPDALFSPHFSEKLHVQCGGPLRSLGSFGDGDESLATSLASPLLYVHTIYSMQFPTRPPTSRMATPAATATTVAFPSISSSSLLLPRRRFLPPASDCCRIHPPPRCRAHLRVTRQVALGSDVSSSSDVATEEAAAARKAPGLELCGMEGVVKQYVGVWKGKRITGNLPFKVEFELKLDGQGKPARFLAHLREEEFEIVGDQ
jgi:hypothetical protein